MDCLVFDRLAQMIFSDRGALTSQSLSRLLDSTNQICSYSFRYRIIPGDSSSIVALPELVLASGCLLSKMERLEGLDGLADRTEGHEGCDRSIMALYFGSPTDPM